MKYSEKLKDPRWQKKRLEILEKNNWQCEVCENNKKTLHVHHLVYENLEPWEYKDKDLIVLCNICHGYLHKGLNIPQLKCWIENRSLFRFIVKEIKPVCNLDILMPLIISAYMKYKNENGKTKSN